MTHRFYMGWVAAVSHVLVTVCPLSETSSKRRHYPTGYPWEVAPTSQGLPSNISPRWGFHVFYQRKCLEYPYCNFLFSRTGTRTPSTGNRSTGSGKECGNVSVHKNYYTKGRNENYAEQCNVIHLVLVCMLHKTQQATVVVVDLISNLYSTLELYSTYLSLIG